MSDKLYSVTYKPSEIIKLPEQMDHHNHGYNQVVIGLSGQTEFDIEGAGNLVCPGQGCLVAADSEHAFSGIGNNEILVLNVPVEQSQAVYTSNNLSRLFEQSGYFHLDRQAQNLIQVLTAEMIAHPDDLLLSKACTDTLMCVLHRHFKPLNEERHFYRLNMDIIDQYIVQHLTRKISVSQLAGLVFLGESQFHFLFKEQTGMTPHQYVLKKRLELARELIEESKLSVAQVAHSTGFASQSSFTQSFTRLFGKPPARYRKDNQGY
ncbi:MULTISPECIES: helix-turn-helix domain-containing protein [Photobacterium]|uniref:AraC family transcriptional regulator n=1 Tax=Photobacterium ganghwense TaxID=320778 RepID=A0A0J1HE42_9GAMM|nr:MULTISPECIES: AraC family transcriptional regulator [Photobacterium]KLV09883.1 AraC family transcriptional regulator [Photobacterium ganghwense]MBV1839547.1 AraC family transcriptional regulator [Photobacterium ganghwense]PSU09271.1 AraC family transcriptional regulator [Photobacterium ganghwense]QSV16460.1 helix-turn-helix domain-containing protein [Photobacterium ganghwense]